MTARRVSRKGAQKTKQKPVFDKYLYYRKSVQAPDNDVEFFRDTYRGITGKMPTTLREDFCGTFSICCSWAKLNSKFRAIGIDLDPEPIQYGKEHYLPQLSNAQKERVEIHEANVLDPKAPKADIICAMNFSHYIFKDRATLKGYFQNCYNTCNDGGIFIADSFGGSRCGEANEESTKHKGFTYYWDQDSFDPVTNFAQFYIHFKLEGEKKREKVFSYDWRMWTLPELKEIMTEVGFKNVKVYWEGTTRSGEGNGVFKPVEKGEECQAWIAYVIGQKT